MFQSESPERKEKELIAADLIWRVYVCVCICMRVCDQSTTECAETNNAPGGVSDKLIYFFAAFVLTQT